VRACFGRIGVSLSFAIAASAQSTPKMETFLGYTYVRANSATDVPSFNANGGSGQLAYNLNQWISAVADLGAVHNRSIGGLAIDSTFANFLFGSRLSFRNSRVRPYLQVLWGGVYATSSTRVALVPLSGKGGDVLPVIPGEPITARLVASQTAFAMAAGGGLDIELSKHLSFRPIGLDYYLTRLQNLRTLGDNDQNNLRYTAGLNFTFGAQ
jgi:opacity protein-like surface antigen